MGRGPLILLDTHALVWFAQAAPEIGRTCLRLVDQALADGSLAVSTISFWEIAMLVQKGRLELDVTPAEFRRLTLEQGVDEWPIDGGVALDAAGLKGLPGDPADRLILATARVHDATLVTADKTLLGWRGRIKRHNARR